MPVVDEKRLSGPNPATHANRYSDAEKQAALALYVEHGPSEAGRQLGIPHNTIVQWARQAGVETRAVEFMDTRIQVSTRRWQERRVALAERVGDLAEHALEVAEDKLTEGDTRAAKDASATMATAIDKAQLLTGGVTERVGVDESYTEREREIEQIRARAREVTSGPAALPEAPDAPANLPDSSANADGAETGASGA